MQSWSGIRAMYWVVVGALFSACLVGIMTIGVFGLPIVAGLMAAGLLVRQLRGREVVAAIAGLAAGPLYVGWLNRSGPGERCRTTGVDQECAQLLDPGPFVGVGIGLVLCGWLLARRLGRASMVGDQ